MVGIPFEAGKSGNPSGRPKIPAEVRELARAMTVEALQTAGEIMRDTQQTGPARMSAVNTILDRAWGKPAQPVDGDGEGGPIQQLVEIRFVKPDGSKASG